MSRRAVRNRADAAGGLRDADACVGARVPARCRRRTRTSRQRAPRSRSTDQACRSGSRTSRYCRRAADVERVQPIRGYRDGVPSTERPTVEARAERHAVVATQRRGDRRREPAECPRRAADTRSRCAPVVAGRVTYCRRRLVRVRRRHCRRRRRPRRCSRRCAAQRPAARAVAARAAKERPLPDAAAVEVENESPP